MEYAAHEFRDTREILITGIGESLSRGRISPEHARDVLSRAGLGPEEIRSRLQGFTAKPPTRPEGKPVPATSVQQAAVRAQEKYVETLRGLDLKPRAPEMSLAEKIRYTAALRRVN